MTAALIPKRDLIAHEVELYACVLLALRTLVVDAQLRLLRWFVLMVALCTQWSRRRCHDARLRRCADPSALAAGAVLPLALRTVRPESAFVAMAGAAGTLTLAWRQRVQLDANAAVGAAMGVVSLLHGVGWTSAAIIAAVPLMQLVLICTLQGVFTGGEAALASSAMAAAFLRGARRAESVDEALLNISLLGACGMVLVVLDAAATPGGLRRRLAVTAMALAPWYGAAWRVWGGEPVWHTLRWACNSGVRRALVGAWGAATLTMVTVVRPGAERGEHHVARKLYHLLAAAIFVGGVAADATLTAVAGAAALALLVGGEALRVGTRCGTARAWVLRVGAQLLDERDGGVVAVSHVYLLLACVAPLAAAPAERAPALGGVVAVCALDSVAALVGRRLGRVPLAHGRSLEGASAGAVAALVAALALRFERAPRLPFACAFAALLETCTAQLDNLVLPLAFLAAYGTPL